MKEEFKYNLYFALYKDKPFVNRERFRNKFKKEQGNYRYIKKLTLDIEEYQHKTYGQILPASDFVEVKTRQERKKKAKRKDKENMIGEENGNKK